MRIQDGDRLLFIGDSITDCGRARPVGEGAGLGNGYVADVDALLTLDAPDRKVRTLNLGIGGNTVRDLAARWDADVLALQPTVLCVMIGTNDVWRKFDQPTNPDAGVSLREYEDTLAILVDRARHEVRRVILATPFYIEPNKADPMRAEMDRYGAAVRKLADRVGVGFVDTQLPFDRITRFRYPAAIAWDRVHPDRAGHLALAKAFLAVLS